MSQRLLSSFKVVVFDVYGTLVDWESGIYNSLLPILPLSWSREAALLAYSSVEKDVQARHPKMLYHDVLAKAHEALWERINALNRGGGGEVVNGTEPIAVRMEFVDSLKTWPVFPDTMPALLSLSDHFKLVVLSNTDHESFSITHQQLAGGTRSELKSPFTLVLTAQDIGAYKPSLACLRHALSVIGTSPEFEGVTSDDVLVVAHSLYHDHIPANQLGLSSVWIDRVGAVMGVEKDDRDGAKWGWRFATLGEMAEAVEQELKDQQP